MVIARKKVTRKGEGILMLFWFQFVLIVVVGRYLIQGRRSLQKCAWMVYIHKLLTVIVYAVSWWWVCGFIGSRYLFLLLLLVWSKQCLRILFVSCQPNVVMALLVRLVLDKCVNDPKLHNVHYEWKSVSKPNQHELNQRSWHTYTHTHNLHQHDKYHLKLVIANSPLQYPITEIFNPRT